MTQYFYIDETRDAGLLPADVFTGTIHLHEIGISSEHYQDIAAQIAD